MNFDVTPPSTASNRRIPALLTDDDLDDLVPNEVVGWMLEALRLHGCGKLTSPPRARADLGDGSVVVTAGRGPRWYGYRVYDTIPTPVGDQVIVTHDAVTGEVLAVAIGARLGALRTGAIGGAAASRLGPVDSCRVGVIGSGTQAWAQLWALSGVLDIAEVGVWSRTPSGRQAFAARARDELGLHAVVGEGAEQVVRGADVLVLATSSARPVLDAAWLGVDVLVITVGPKQVGRAELPLELVTGADLVTTDSLDQLHAYDPPALVAAAGLAGAVVPLGHLAQGRVSPLRSRRRVYLSVGLAGTEVELLGRLAAARGLGGGSGVGGGDGSNA